MDLGRRLDKTTKVIDDFSTAELLFDEQRAGPPFVFKETDTMFILIVSVKGYKRENIKVGINKARNQVAVFGEKPVQETVMVGNMMNKTEMKMRGFKRAFHFSDGVILDGIKVRFNEQEFMLTILIPKLERGFRGTRVEEVKQEEIGGTYEPLCMEENRVDEIKTLGDEKLGEVDVKEEKDTDGDVVEVHEEEQKKVEIVQELDQTQTYPMETFKDQGFEGKQDNINPNEVQHVQEPVQIPSDPLEAINYQGFEGEEEKKKIENEDEGVKRDEKKKIENEDEGLKRDEKQKIENEDEGVKRDEKKKIENEDEGLKRDESPKIKKNKCKLCDPLILGSTVLLTISVLVIYLLRNQNPHGKRKN